MVPIEEVVDWTDLDLDLLNHLTHVSQIIGKAIDTAFNPTKVGLMIAGRWEWKRAVVDEHAPLVDTF